MDLKIQIIINKQIIKNKISNAFRVNRIKIANKITIIKSKLHTK